MRLIPVTLLGVALLAPVITQPAEPPSPTATRASAASPAARTASTGKVAAKSADRAVDRLELDSTAITGNRELPKVMSIVPWKPAEPPAGPDRPMGSLIEEVLAPVDRDEFRREITYFRDLTSQSDATETRPSPGANQP
jgi:hypothetical protein